MLAVLPMNFETQPLQAIVVIVDPATGAHEHGVSANVVHVDEPDERHQTAASPTTKCLTQSLS